MAVTISLFFDRLRASELFEPEEVEALWQRVPADKRQIAAEKLVPKLIETKKLTAYQAYALLKGNSDPLLLGDYSILERIGQGGMGQVFKAEHRRMKRIVALKVLPASAVRSEDAVKRFQREVQAAARLLHPNIVAAFDAGQSNDVHFLVMEYVHGDDLAAISRARGQLPVPQVIDYMLQAARGLAYAHGKGVVHRDIKPANLLVDDEGNVKILDMGLARVEAGTAAMKDQLTQSGQVMGTLDFMAPEQAYDTRSADARADIYSLGCTMYRLLMAETMFAGDSLVQVIMAHREQPIPSLADRRPDVPAALDALFRKMVAKTPEERPASMGEVVSALEALKEGSSASVLATEPDLELSKFLASDVGKGKSAVGRGSSVSKGAAARGSSIGKGSGSSLAAEAGKSAKPSRPPPRGAAALDPPVSAPAGATLNMGNQPGDTNRDANDAAAAVAGLSAPRKWVPRQRSESAASASTSHDPEQESTSAEKKPRGKKSGSTARAALIAGGAALGACLLVGGVLAVVLLATSGRGKTKSDVDQTVDSQSGNDGKPKQTTPNKNTQKPPNTNRPSTTGRPATGQSAGSGSASALPPGQPADKLSGLLADPPRVPNLGRWQVDTAAPRRPVWTVAWSADSKRLAVAGNGYEVRVYDVNTWRLQNVLLGHTGAVQSVAWSPDGSRLVSCSADKTVRLWRADGTPGPIIPGYARPNVVSFSPNGQWFAVGDGDNKSYKLQIFKPDGTPGPAFFGHTSGIWGLAWSADSEQFVSAGEDKTLRVWSAGGGDGREISGHDAPLRNVAWSADGRLAAVDSAGTVYVYPKDLANPKVYSKIGARAVAFNASGSLLAVGKANQVDMWNADDQSTGQPIEAPGGVVQLAFSPDDSLVAWAGVNAGAFRPGGAASVLETATTAMSLSWNPEGNRFVSTHADGRLRWWRSDGSLEEASPAVSAALTNVSWSPAGDQVAACGGSRLFFWDSDRTPKSSFDLANTKRTAQFLGWNLAGDQLLSGADEPRIHMYSPAGQAGVELSGHTKPITGISWCKGGEGLIATSSSDGTVRIWRPDGTPGPEISLTPLPGALAWRPDGQILAVAPRQGGNNARLSLWNPDGTPGPDVVSSSDVRGLAWSPDGEKFAGLEAGGTVKIWQHTGVLERTLAGSVGGARSIAWSKDGLILASGDERTLRAWDAETGQPIWVGVALGQDYFAAVGADGKPVGSLLAAERSLVYYVERGGGRIEIVLPSAFEKL